MSWDPFVLADIITKFAIYYKETLHEDQIAMYVQDLSRLSPEQLDRAMRIYRQNPKNDRFPLPAVLIALVNQQEDSLDVGRMVAGRINDASRKFGTYRVAEAKEFIGELGWLVVQQSGGWGTVCNESTNGTKTAQMRDLAAALHRAALSGKMNEPIAIPAPHGQVSIASLVQTAKNLLEKK